MAATPAAAAPARGAGVLRDEAAQIRQVLEQTRGNIVQAARLLGLKRSTLRYRMVRAGLGSPRGGAVPAVRTARHGATLPPQERSRDGPLGEEAVEPLPGWEQKLVAVLAIDLSFPMATGFTALPYEPRTVARRWKQAIAEKVQGFGGVLLQRTASPLLVAFGLPQTLEQLPQRAVQTALTIRQLVTEAQATSGAGACPRSAAGAPSGHAAGRGAGARTRRAVAAGRGDAVGGGAAVRACQTRRGAGVPAARTAGHWLVCAAGAPGASRWRTA